MIFNLISKNNGVNGAVIKNNGTDVFTPIVGTIYSCTKDLLPKSAGINDFYYMQEDNSLLVGQGAGKPLKEITGVIISDSAGVNLNDYVTKDALADNLDTVTNNIKTLIPDITEYMKSVDIQAALNTKANASNVYSKTEIDTLIDAIKAGTADLDLYLTKADANSTYALKNHTHDMSSYLTAADIADFTTSSDVDNKIAAAGLTGGKDVDLSAYLTITDADTTYLKKTDAVTTAAVQAMIDGAGHIANADIVGFLDKDTADTLYQPAGTYLDKNTADTLYQPIGASSVEIDFATPEEVLTAITTTDVVEETTQEPTE